MTANSQYGFTQEIMLNQLIDFCSEMTGLVDDERVGDIIYFIFSKAFNTVSYNILIDNLMKYKLDKWTVRWTKNWLNCWAQSIEISDTKSSQRLVTNCSRG